ncbi:MAG: T9SS type A sorting domain-containing protein [Bacteroidetes bacterium]|nr:T9SS type A sorting domain-containing protein [Bacteroidota bacterium]
MGRSNPVLLDTCSYHNLEIRLGYTTKTQFNLTAEDSLITGLTPVYFASTRFFSGLLSGMGTWLKFPVSDFILDHKSNLVIEISNGIEPTQNNGKFDLIASNKTNPIARSIIAPKDSAIGSAGISNVLDVGFDINPTGVAGINNIQAMGLFPNPSTDGYFVLSLESGKAIKTLSVAIMDVTGRTVLRKEYASVGTEFGQEIDARQLPKGCYMVLINADGEKITRKLLLQ